MNAYQVRHLALQILRRMVQASVMAVVIAVVYLSLYAHYRAARALEDDQLMAGFQGKVLRFIDDTVAPMEQPQQFLDGFKGTLWSMRLWGVELSDPLAAAEMVVASKTLYGPMLLSILIPVLVTLLLGRVFCSGICPGYVLFELAGKLRKLLRFAELPPGEVEFSHGNKYAFLGAGLIVAAVAGLPFFALIYPPAVISRLVHAWIFGTAFTGMLLILGIIIAVEVFVSRRWWCRTLCPGGALYGLLGAGRLLRIRLDANLCTGCRECEPVCEEGLNPVLQSYEMECDNCGVCLRHCPEKALLFTAGLPGRSRARIKKSHPPEKSSRTAMAAVILVSALLPASAAAHHILGLPHYSYKENYPQVPILEYPASTGPYDILLTSYPGRPIPGETANLAFYIKNRDSGQPYQEPIRVRILRTFTFGRSLEVLSSLEVIPYEQPHSLSATFPQEGEYIVELSLDVEGKTEVIPFLVVSGDPTATVSVVIAVVLGLAFFIIVIRAIRIKRERRQKEAETRA